MVRASDGNEPVDEEAGGSAPQKRPRPTNSNLSEHWSVTSKHEGCYTGGKVLWNQTLGRLGCLCNEEMHVVGLHGKEPPIVVAEEADAILTFAIDPAGENACTSHRSGLMRHYRLDGGKPTMARAWKAHDQVVSDVAFDATGNFVATGCVDKTAKVWDFTGYFCTHNFKGHPSLVSIVRFHPKRLQLVTVADTEIRLFDLKSSTLVGLMKDHLATISSISFGPGSKAGDFQLISGGRDQVVNIWQLDKDKVSLARSVPVFETVEGVTAVATADLKTAAQAGAKQDTFSQWLCSDDIPAYAFITVGSKCQLRVWNPKNGKCLGTIESPHAAKGLMREVMSVSASGNQIVSIGDDMNIVLWDLPELKVSSYIMGHNDEIVHVQFIPELTYTDDNNGGSSCKVSSKRFLCLANDEHPRLVNARGFNATFLRGHKETVLACDVSADGAWIATGSKDQSAKLWSAEDARLVAEIAGHAGAVSALSFPKKRPKNAKGAAAASKEPLILVSGSHDKTIKLWQLPSPVALAAASSPVDVQKAKITVLGHSKEINAVIVAPNNKLFASAGQDKLVRVWTFPDLKLLGECKGHRKAVWSVAFSPIDQVIASASGDGTARLWNLKDFTAIRSFQGHTGAVLKVAFLGNGMQFMTGGADGLVKLWQIRTADCAASFDEHEGKVWCVDIIGDKMVSGGSDSKLCIWRDTSEEHAKVLHNELAEIAAKDTRIGLLAKEGKIEQALSLALELDRPGQMRQILSTYALNIVSKRLDAEEGAEMKEPDPPAQANIARWVRSLKQEQLEKFIGILDQWNTNRKMAPLAHMFLNIVLAEVPPDQLMKIEGMNATCESLLSYFERHQARVDALLQKTFVFDLVLQSSGLGLSMLEEFDNEPSSALPIAEVTASKETPYKVSGDEKAGKDALKATMDVLMGGSDDDDDDEDEGELDDEVAAAAIAEMAEDNEDSDDEATLRSAPPPKKKSRKKST